jgi:D-aminopeptidase
VVQTALRQMSEHAVRQLGAFATLHLESPTDMEIDTVTTVQADIACLIPGVERRGARTIGYRAADPDAMYRALMAVIYSGASA